MDGFRNLSRSFVEAAALGLLATAVLYVQPPQIAARLDGWLFDTWSGLAPPAPPDDILLVQLPSPTVLEELIDAAERESAQLVISTLPQPPPVVTDLAIGPVEVRVGPRRTRSTAWLRGGHLWVEPDVDGVVRHDSPLPGNGNEPPSLALYAVRLLANAHRGVAPPDAVSQRWLRFHGTDSFASISAAEALAAPEQLRNRIVVAGLPEPIHVTPLGLIGTPELVAEMLTNHRQDRWLTSGAPGSLGGWSLALLVLAAVGFLTTTRGAAAATIATSSIALLGVSALLFNTLDVWLPATGPTAWILLAGSLLVMRRQAAFAVIQSATAPEPLVAARRAAADGRLYEAWALYRQLSASSALLSELYDLACALDDQDARDAAADLYHRVAQVDGRFRDVAARLVRASHPNDVPPNVRLAMPATLGRYQLLAPIGRGAMGCVYLGRDPIISRIVALKAIDLTLDYEGAELESVSESFLREATIAGGLSHPNIVTVFDVGQTDGLAYIAMEYLKGRHLSEFVTLDRLLPVETVVDLLSRTADALDYAHAQNVVHRDIKPANIMYDSTSDTLKITDFGIAKLSDANRTRTGVVLGTPAFMSPEQLEGRNVNGHTDLFALGVSLYQLLTGHLPFRGASMTKLMFVIANEPHQSVISVRADLPQWLDGVVDRALAKDPANRYQTGAEMAAALRGGLVQAA